MVPVSFPKDTQCSTSTKQGVSGSLPAMVPPTFDAGVDPQDCHKDEEDYANPFDIAHGSLLGTGIRRTTPVGLTRAISRRRIATLDSGTARSRRTACSRRTSAGILRFAKFMLVPLSSSSCGCSFISPSGDPNVAFPIGYKYHIVYQATIAASDLHDRLSRYAEPLAITAL